MAVRTALRPGAVSPTLPVPRSIARPEYVGKATAQEGSEPWVQTPEVIEKMRVAGRIAAGALAEACLLYTSPSPRDRQKSRMPSSA